MKQELLTQLVKELFGSVDELHQEYKDNEISYVIDAKKEDNVLNITISLNENKDKEEFQKWIQELDDDIYEETIESLKDKIKNLNEVYESEDYQDVIDAFKNKVKEIAQSRIDYLKTLC